MSTEDDRPPSLADGAYAELRDRIVDCRLLPGERVTEKQLAGDLGFGLTPIRQALARLDSEGLVRTLPRRGYQVTPLTIGSVNEFFQVWRIIGPAIAEIAGQNMSAAQRSRVLSAYTAKAQPAREAGDVTMLLDASEELWNSLAEATGNRRLVAMYVRLTDELRRIFRLVFQDQGATGVLAELEHVESWMIADDPAKYRAHIEQFIDAVHHGVLAILTSWPSVVEAEVVPPVAWFLH